MKNSILYIDDNKSSLNAFRIIFSDHYKVYTASSTDEGYKIIKNENIWVALIDQRLSEETGTEFIKRTHKEFPEVKYMIISGYADFEVIMEAFNESSIYRFILKPWNETELRIDIDNALHQYELQQRNKVLYMQLKKQNNELKLLKSKLEKENESLKEEIKLNKNFPGIIYADPKFESVLKHVVHVAESDATVLVTGETGTGKELLAGAIHEISNRRNKPFIKVNCAALPESLIESELFGHEKGAFTGAMFSKKGKFEFANQGTIFLDEIGDLPIHLQSKILRVIQEKEFERIGSNYTQKLNIRIIAATNKNLKNEIANGRFREDLFYRLSVFPVHIPALRERPKDIRILIKYFMEKYNRKYSRSVSCISSENIEYLLSYHWPGNVRELENIIEHSILVSTGTNLNIDKKALISCGEETTNRIFSLKEIEKKHILSVLELTSWKISGKNGAAELLEMNRTTLLSKMKQLDIKREYSGDKVHMNIQ